MKKMIFAAALLSLVAVKSFAQAGSQDIRERQMAIQNGVKIPDGYQGHIEQENIYHFSTQDVAIGLSTTHGFFYTPHMFVGLGLGLHIAEDDVIVPFFTSAKYIFNNYKKISPTMQLRLGSYASEGVGAYGDLAFGLRFASNKDFAFSILLAGSYYSPKDETNWYYDDRTNTSYSVTEKLDFSGISLRIGIEW